MWHFSLKSRGVVQMYNPSLRLKGHNPKSTLSHENLNRGRYQTLASADLRIHDPRPSPLSPLV